MFLIAPLAASSLSPQISLDAWNRMVQKWPSTRPVSGAPLRPRSRNLKGACIRYPKAWRADFAECAVRRRLIVIGLIVTSPLFPSSLTACPLKPAAPSSAVSPVLDGGQATLIGLESRRAACRSEKLVGGWIPSERPNWPARSRRAARYRHKHPF